MYDEYRKRIKHRILLMDVASVFLILSIMCLVFGFLVSVFSFEYSKAKPSVISLFSDETWRFRETLAEANKHIESIQNDKSMNVAVKAIGFQNNVVALNESLKATNGHLNEFAKAVYENQGKLIDSFLNEKRILFALSGLFVAYLVKLFSGLYKYNAYVKAHYSAVLDALELAMNESEKGASIDLKRFKEMLAALSVKDLRIDQGGSLLEELLSKKEKADA